MNQARALDILKAGRNVYLTGAAGSGKTHTLNQYITYLKHRGVPVAVTASTGIAATHIGGVTIHSWSGIGVKETLSAHDIESLTQKEYLYKRISKTKVLVIDEISMLGPGLLDSVDRVCRAMKQSDKPFGGVQIVLTGDFFQLPPVVRGGGKAEFAIAARAWRDADIRVCYLDEQFRHDDSTLEGILNEMRLGTVTDHAREILAAHINKKPTKDMQPTRLFTHNTDVDALNDEELAKLPNTAYEFNMETKGKANLVSSLQKSILAPEVLRLKKDAVVMFVKNNFDEGYVNGTLGVVKDFINNKPVVRTFSGKEITVDQAEWQVEEDGKVLASVKQLPLRLAWAITVHKSQGMSLDAAEIDLSKAFVPGQGYVALSRLRTLDGLFLKGFNDTVFDVHPDVAIIDEYLRKESAKWDKLVEERFSANDMKKMHDAFVVACGGTINKKEIAKNKEKKAEEFSSERVATHEKTRILLEKGLSLKEIAQERGQTIGSILTHCEKLKKLGEWGSWRQLELDPNDLEKIREAFEAVGGAEKLGPTHQKLKGKYSYEDIRLARLFL